MYQIGKPQPINLVPADDSSVGPLAAADYDGDGFLDLFVGGRVKPGEYPAAARSHLYRQRDSKLVLDEANTATKTVLMLKVGGGNNGIGIHGTHLGPGVRIRYAHSDEQRQTIPWIEYNGPGRRTVYAAAGSAAKGS